MDVGIGDVEVVHADEFALDVEVEFLLQEALQVFVDEEVVVVLAGVVVQLLEEEGFALVVGFPEVDGEGVLAKPLLEVSGGLLIEAVLFAVAGGGLFFFVRQCPVLEEDVEFVRQ